MRKIYFYGAMSLDGYLADEHDSIQWLYDSDAGGVSTFEDFQQLFDTMVMGRITYDVTLKLLDGAPYLPGKEKTCSQIAVEVTFKTAIL
ncbi:hypothetical protein [Secundilactobacillus folii]|uniref:hypothetical protein n=1 Tax=Secundilactobacillus folii TaxID=2678357 RepID=UPI001FEB6DE8|nr:hypothetical protein [Secundilactobacillus folii]